MPDSIKEVTTDKIIHLESENARLLSELEVAYKNMERILEDSEREKEITYKELQNKYTALEKLYDELSNKENMLIHMEKLSSIGQFISELIHELSSPLTAITLQSQMAALLDLPESTKKQFKVVEQHADRMSNLLARFKAMAYKGKEDFKLFELRKNLIEGIQTIDIIKPKIMTVESEIKDEEIQFLGDPYQISQVYLNLSKNAFDAMKGNGKKLKIILSVMSSSQIETGKTIGKNYCQKIEEWEAILKKYENFALIEFTDEGPGMSADLMENIFQAFFTTKERGKGTGLGLSISSDIAKRHNGNLAVKSKLGIGTTFQLFLPIHAEEK